MDILYLIRKEFLQIFRSREMLGIIFGVPIIQMLVLGFAITNEAKHVPIVVVDEAQSPLSRKITSSLQHTDRFDFYGSSKQRPEALSLIRNGKCKIALFFPRDFGYSPFVSPEIVQDGVDGNQATVAGGYLSQIIREKVKKQSRPAIIERYWYNENLASYPYNVPGIIAVLLTVISMMLSSMSLVREKEIGTLEQLMVTPLHKFGLLAGKILPFLLLSVVEMQIVLQIAQVIFGIHMQGSYWELTVFSVLYLFCTLGLGIFASTISGTQQQAMLISWFFMMFMILLSGFFSPIGNMPIFMQKLTLLNPMRHFMTIIREIFQKGTSFNFLWDEFFWIGGLGIFFFTVGLLKFHKKVG